MKAIQTTGQIDAEGKLSLDHPIECTLPSSVRVIILFAETDTEADTDEFWESISKYQQRTLMSAKQLENGLKQVLTEAGYDSKEKIIDLVQDVKREIAAERQQHQDG